MRDKEEILQFIDDIEQRIEDNKRTLEFMGVRHDPDIDKIINRLSTQKDILLWVLEYNF